ncbi:YbaB/EbfC family nucleoid-associated protein [Streptomyces sp. NPDC055078]
MTEPIQVRLANAVARLEQTRQAVAATEERLRAASVTVRSRDRSVEVTVDAQGHLAEVRFLDGKYRAMGAAQLAAAVIEAAREGEAKMARTVMETFRPLADSIGDRPHVEGSRADWDNMFGPLLDSIERGETARRGAGDRLRDEITEDGEPTPPAADGANGRRRNR